LWYEEKMLELGRLALDWLVNGWGSSTDAAGSVIDETVSGNGQVVALKLFVQNMQWLVKSVSSSFSKDLSHEAKAKDSTRKAKTKDSTLKAKTKDFKIVLEDSNTGWQQS